MTAPMPVNTYSVDGTELADSGTVADARGHVHTDYDQGAPVSDDGPYMLPTTETVTARTAGGVEHDPSVSKTGYEAVRAGDPTGWSLMLAMAQTDPGGLVTQTRYDSAGRVIETVLPNDGANAGVRTTVTAYYTAAGSGDCVSAVQAGWVCSTGPAAQPDTGAPLPITTYTWDALGDQLAKTETFGTGGSAVARVTADSFDAAGRQIGESIDVTPAGAGGAPVPAVAYGWDPATGLPTTVSTATGGVTATLTVGYDALGRVVSYTDAAGNVSTTSYDLSGRVTAVDDGKGVTSYGYDPYSGLPTAEDIGAPVGQPGGFTAAYDGDGSLTSVTYPNGLVADTVYDNAGQPVSLVYTGPDGQVWLSFAQTADVQGRTVSQSGPMSSQVFGYDGSGRLVKVEDTVSDPARGAVACAVRAYGFDADSNRVSYQVFPDDGSDPDSGHCASVPASLPHTSTFDQADRVTDPGYAYDQLGRTLTVPAGDAAGIGSHAAITGDLTVGYWADDMVASESQDGRSMTFTLDPLQNRIASFTGADGAVTTNHYTGNGDSPAWAGTGDAWTRNLIGIDGGLAGTVDQAGQAILQMANPHGDIVATVADDPAAVGPDSYSESTEYGQPRDPATAPDAYGWLGTAQRSTDTLGGLTLMGVRLYSPTTGRFLTTDPVVGGGSNCYAYPPDPINGADTTGQSWVWSDWGFNVMTRTHYFNIGASWGWLDYQVAAGKSLQWALKFTSGVLASKATQIYVRVDLLMFGRATYSNYQKTKPGNYLFHGSFGRFNYHGDRPWTSHYVSKYKSVAITLRFSVAWYNPAYLSCNVFYLTQIIYLTTNKYR